ncbi:MAG: hypothetical protein N3F63_04885 [Thermoplasmata archaeon]|nr:hypothetical protein [Thermoplasmata archaeon]
MVNLINEMRIRAIVHATESVAKVKDALVILAPDAKIRENHTTGYHGNEILVLEAVEAKNCAQMEELLKREGIFEEVLKSPEVYIHEGVLHLKLDKQRLYSEKKLMLGGMDTISVHLRIGSKSEPIAKTVNSIRRFLRGEEK